MSSWTCARCGAIFFSIPESEAHTDAGGCLAHLVRTTRVMVEVRGAAHDLLAYLRACNAADHVEEATNRSNAENLRHYMRALRVALGEDA